MKLLVSLILILFLASCGGSAKVAQPEYESVAVYQPDWFDQHDENYYTGYATSDSKNRQFALNKAKSEAINEISRQLEVRNQSLMKKFTEETGVGEEAELLETATQAIKQTTSSVLKGLRTDKTEVRKNTKTSLYTAFVKVTVPKAEIANDILGKLKKKENMYTKFQAMKAFKELDDEAKKMDDYKKEND